MLKSASTRPEAKGLGGFLDRLFQASLKSETSFNLGFGFTPYSVNGQNFGFVRVDFWVLVGENRDFRPQIRILREILV